MKTIRFFTDSKRFLGWRKATSFRDQYLELESWIESGNYLKVNNLVINSVGNIKKIYN